MGTGVFGGCKVVEPQVRPPTPRQLEGMDDADRALLARVLSEPIEYIDHVLFRQANVEKVLFGEKATLGDGSTYFAENREVDPASGYGEGSALNSAQEILLFQRFNYARLRIARVLTKYKEKSMPTDVVRDLLAWAHRATIARGMIVQANVPLVLAMAKRTRL